MKLLPLFFSSILLFACSSNDDSIGIKPNSPLIYNGGSVMTEPVNIYIVWYGNISQNFKDIVADFVFNMNGSPWMNINSTYYQIVYSNPPELKAIQTIATSNIIYNKSVEDNYSFGNSLNLSNVRDIVALKIKSGDLPEDYNGIYVVFTSGDVTQINNSGTLCKNWCGVHANIIMNWDNNFHQKYLKLISIGELTNCPACIVPDNYYISPNNNPTADAAVSILAHEITETITDPTFTSWISIDGQMLENGDLCAWRFGEVYKLQNNSYANIRLNNKEYLIQENWVNLNGGYCSLSIK